MQADDQRSTTQNSHNLNGTFISEKINKIRWKPEYLQEPHYFVTGSYDNDVNRIRLWDVVDSIEDEDSYPVCIGEQPYCGDVTEMMFLESEHFVTSSSSGSANLMHIAVKKSGEPHLINDMTWKDLHHFKNGESSSCTALTVQENDIVTAGEDGRINLLNAQCPEVVRVIENADSCSIHCVLFLKHNEVLSSNLRGQMKVWDLRSDKNKPIDNFMLSGDQVAPTYLIYHPTQRHIIIAGDELGALTTWDLRQNSYPVNVLNAHEGAISEIQFHSDNPAHLFSCSSAGELWHWSTRSSYLQNDETNVWLAPENVKNKMEVLTLMPTLGKPINSLDVSRNKVVCGCDNEAIYLINGIVM